LLRERFDNPLDRPTRGWMPGHVEVDNHPPIMPQHNENKQDAKRSRWYGQEIDRNNVSQVIIQKRPPGLRWRFVRPDFVRVDGRLGHNVTEERQFGLNTRRSLERILV